MLEHTKLRHFWAQIVSWAPRYARKTFIVPGPGLHFTKVPTTKNGPQNNIEKHYTVYVYYHIEVQLQNIYYYNNVLYIYLSSYLHHRVTQARTYCIIRKFAAIWLIIIFNYVFIKRNTPWRLHSLQL